MRQKGMTFGKRIFVISAMMALALVQSPPFTNTTQPVAAMNPCQDECEADLKAQRLACLNSGLPPLEVIQCYQDAQAAFQLCMASCQ